jgi:hypothetical protein
MEEIANPVEYLDQLGGMHDARVLSISIDCVASRLIFVVDDLNANFEELDGYPGEVSAELVFAGISDVSVTNGHFEKSGIFDCVAQAEAGAYLLRCRASPSGEIEFKFLSMSVTRLNG